MGNLENFVPVVAAAIAVSSCGGAQAEKSELTCPSGSHADSGVLELKPFTRAVEACLSDRFGGVEDLREQCDEGALMVEKGLMIEKGMWRCAPKKPKYSLPGMKGDVPVSPVFEKGNYVFSGIEMSELTDQQAVEAVIECVRKKGGFLSVSDADKRWDIYYQGVEKRKKRGKNLVSGGTSRLRITEFNSRRGGDMVRQFEDGTAKNGADGFFDLALDLSGIEEKCSVSQELIDDDASWKLMMKKGRCGGVKNPEALRFSMQRRYGNISRRIAWSSVCRGK